MRIYPVSLVAGMALAALHLSAIDISPVPPSANLRVATIQVRVAPDHRDWSYKVGEPVKFKVMVTADNEPIDNATVSYSVGPEMMPAEIKTAAVPSDGLVIEGGTMKEPGFLRCIVTIEVAGRNYKGMGTAGFSPEKIVPFQTEPADFDAYWSAQKAKLAHIPVEARVTLLPDDCTAKVNVYQVSIPTHSGPEGYANARIYGILCEPKAPGKYPAVLKVPGAHARPYFGDKDLAARGAMVLEIGINGLPVNLPKEVYDALDAGVLNAAWYNNLDDRDNYFYHRVFLGCIRANDFLTSREMWDGKNLLVMGASQGGALSIVTAALDPRVSALSATHPALCDLTAELHGRAAGFPHPFKPNADGTPSIHSTPVKIANSAYYDSVNFARRLKVPGFYTWGYNDDVCPPTSTYAAFNVITAPKTLAIQPEQGHNYPQEQWEVVNNWVTKQLGLK